MRSSAGPRNLLTAIMRFILLEDTAENVTLGLSKE